jgi:hypothetical protein
MKVIKGHELFVSAPDRVGLLADVTTKCADNAINILGICASKRENTAGIYLHTDDPFRAAEALSEMHIVWQEVVVVECPSTMGTLKGIAQKLADAHINMLYCYATVGEGPTAKLIMDTSHNDRALEVLSAI